MVDSYNADIVISRFNKSFKCNQSREPAIICNLIWFPAIVKHQDTCWITLKIELYLGDVT